MSSGPWCDESRRRAGERKKRRLQRQKHERSYWARVSGSRVCAAESCKNRTINLLCGPCFNRGLSRLKNLNSFRKFYADHGAKLASMNTASYLGYHPGGRGAW